MKQDTFLWKEWAILTDHNEGTMNGYSAIEDIRDSCDIGDEYISKEIIEAKENEVFFERVYKDTVAWNIFKTADQLKESYKKSFKP